MGSRATTAGHVRSLKAGEGGHCREEGAATAGHPVRKGGDGKAKGAGSEGGEPSQRAGHEPGPRPEGLEEAAEGIAENAAALTCIIVRLFVYWNLLEAFCNPAAA